MKQAQWTTYPALLADEAAIHEEHRREFPELEGRITHYVDVLLRLPEAIPPNADTSSPEGVFHGFAWQRYAIAPYSVRSLVLLLERGHYDSCVLLVRHLLEIFVQIRYFVTRKDKVGGHWHNTNPVPFKQIFDSLCPGYFDRYYGAQMSSAAHGKEKIGPFRFQDLDGTTVAVLKGFRFDRGAAGYAIIHALVLTYGYLKQFPVCYPAARMSVELQTLYAASMRDLEAELAYVAKSSSQATDAMTVLRPLVD